MKDGRPFGIGGQW
jgi:putative SOS response-associated peptidase YedK